MRETPPMSRCRRARTVGAAIFRGLHRWWNGLAVSMSVRNVGRSLSPWTRRRDMALVLTSKCCGEGFRFRSGTIPATTCPRCHCDCEWNAATVPNDWTVWQLTDQERRILKALWIDPEHALEGVPS